MSNMYHFSSIIGPVIERYLKLKRSLGRQFSVENEIFKQLDSFLHRHKKDLTLKSFNDWCRTLTHLTTGVQRNRMRVVRNLCLYRQRTVPGCFVPDKLQFPLPHQAIQPYIFKKIEICGLLEAKKNLRSSCSSPPRKENIRLALILLYTTGLRRGELCSLTIGDYDPVEHTLLIRESKFHKSRLIPLSRDGWNELESYLKIRKQRQLPATPDSALIWSRNGFKRTKTPGFYTGTGMLQNFSFLFKKANIHGVGGYTPRLHDFRHTFAVHALLRWYHENLDVQSKLPLLSTYMGHVSVVSTQYYLRFIEDIVGTASKRFEKRYSKIVKKFSKRGDLL